MNRFLSIELYLLNINMNIKIRRSATDCVIQLLKDGETPVWGCISIPLSASPEEGNRVSYCPKACCSSCLIFKNSLLLSFKLSRYHLVWGSIVDSYIISSTSHIKNKFCFQCNSDYFYLFILLNCLKKPFIT